MSKWLELDPQIRKQAVTYLQKELTSEFFEGMRAARHASEEWWAVGGWHFFQGMQIRNILRQEITDDKLPSKNWDDYYIEALEEAAGL